MSGTLKRILTCSAFAHVFKHDYSKLSTGNTYKGEGLRQYYKENLRLFGKLLEKKVQKRKRLKLEAQGKLSKQRNVYIDTELHWVSKKTKRKQWTLVAPKRKQAEDNNKQSDGDSNVQLIENEITIGSDVSDNFVEDNMFVDDPHAINAEYVENTLPQIPSIIVNNFTTFKIHSGVKPVSESAGILSRSWQEDKPFLHFPSVTKILQATMSDKSKEALERWKQDMIAKLGVEGFEQYSKELLQDGKQLHSCIENTLLGRPFDTPPRVQLAYKSINALLQDITNVRVIESHVVHPKLFYRGIVDCVASYRGKVYAIDWKKSEKPKATIASTFDAPLQLASYIGAINADDNYPLSVDAGLIIVAYNNGDVATVHEIDGSALQKYWQMWLRRLQLYYVGTQKTANTPPTTT